MAGRKPTPKYKQPMPAGLSKAQQLATLKGRIKTAQSALIKGENAKGSGRFRLGVRTGRSALVDNRFLHNCLAKSKFAENQVVAEKLLRIRDDIERHFDIPGGDMETLDNILLRLKKAENSEKKVSLDPHQAKVIENHFSRV